MSVNLHPPPLVILPSHNEEYYACLVMNHSVKEPKDITINSRGGGFPNVGMVSRGQVNEDNVTVSLATMMFL